MKLRAETNFLLRKQLKQALGPFEIIGGAALSTLAFVLAFWSSSCLIRASSPSVAMLIVGVLAIMAFLANYIGVALFSAIAQGKGVLKRCAADCQGQIQAAEDLQSLVGDRFMLVGPMAAQLSAPDAYDIELTCA
ncbi:unnamed protein product [Durusdinium trenchii]|uniref:H(+)-exporting diphosphatase n=1 Tax=Durusdinium trenchii TaxID=1381693 RepID=A0ABP0PPW9_9DINO